MKFSPRNKAAYALAVAFLLPIAVRADSKEIRTKNEFVNRFFDKKFWERRQSLSGSRLR